MAGASGLGTALALAQAEDASSGLVVRWIFFHPETVKVLLTVTVLASGSVLHFPPRKQFTRGI